MRLWAATVVYTYIGIQVFTWVTGLPWCSEFSWPLAIMAGLSLAIASQPQPAKADTVSTSSEQQSDPPSSEDLAADVEIAPPAIPDAAEPSISFTIRKNVRPQ
ncbi:MAG: hypothetical protein AAF821_03025 [Cyanobacteria bacterium P01_D01_bin.156]